MLWKGSAVGAESLSLANHALREELSAWQLCSVRTPYKGREQQVSLSYRAKSLHSFPMLFASAVKIIDAQSFHMEREIGSVSSTSP